MGKSLSCKFGILLANKGLEPLLTLTIKVTVILFLEAHAVYLIFDLTNRDSFNSIKSYWINEAESYTDESVVTVLVGNKCDCPNRAVS